ncbi:hypothetical protein MTR_4g057950 [Medicago truncatula]|uniref:Uncharacterized protein n=1 Tax=Medicago truncatula TaxID=3880 RepID=A0A072ULR1_MEDTR|nr:hypothetical protein MTR_4g057950 [Medicago truncatula]
MANTKIKKPTNNYLGFDDILCRSVLHEHHQDSQFKRPMENLDLHRSDQNPTKPFALSYVNLDDATSANND